MGTCVKVIPDFKNELVAAAVGEKAAKLSADIGAVPDTINKCKMQKQKQLKLVICYA